MKLTNHDIRVRYQIDPVTVPDMGLIDAVDVDIYMLDADDPDAKPYVTVAVSGRAVLQSGGLSKKQSFLSRVVRPGAPAWDAAWEAVSAALETSRLTMEQVDF
jgi:hypothetical protein